MQRHQALDTTLCRTHDVGVTASPIILQASDSRPPSDLPEDDSGIAVSERQKTARPRRFVVVFHNDDYTTQQFVVHVLTTVFHKDATSATQIMLEVHHRGWGVVGVYSRDVAETKVKKALSYAKKYGHPLKVTAEPEGYEG